MDCRTCSILTQTIQAYDRILSVIVRGKVFDRQALAADAH
jgi:hypothetical protein